MPVRSDGAPSAVSSPVSAYSNSKPTMSRPTPSAAPFTARFAGVVVLPMNTVASAKAGVAAKTSSRASRTGAFVPERSERAIAYPNDTIQSAMDFRLSDDQELLRRSIREFAETEIRPHVMEWDEAQHFPTELLPKLAALGLMGIQFPEEYGGAAMSSVDYCICIEELARVDPSVCLSVAAHNGLGAAHIVDVRHRGAEAASTWCRWRGASSWRRGG